MITLSYQHIYMVMYLIKLYSDISTYIVCAYVLLELSVVNAKSMIFLTNCTDCCHNYNLLLTDPNKVRSQLLAI